MNALVSNGDRPFNASYQQTGYREPRKILNRVTLHRVLTALSAGLVDVLLGSSRRSAVWKTRESELLFVSFVCRASRKAFGLRCFIVKVSPTTDDSESPRDVEKGRFYLRLQKDCGVAREIQYTGQTYVSCTKKKRKFPPVLEQVSLCNSARCASRRPSSKAFVIGWTSGSLMSNVLWQGGWWFLPVAAGELFISSLRSAVSLGLQTSKTG